MIFRKDEWVMRCRSGVVLYSSTLSWDKCISLPWLMKFPGRRFMTNQLAPFGRSVLRQIRAQRKILPVSAVFQVSTAQNNQHTKMAYLGTACP